MSISFTESWEKIEQVSRAMLQFAYDHDWHQAVELSKIRHEQLQQHLSEYPLNPHNSTLYHTMISKMIAADQDLQSMLQQTRGKLISENDQRRYQKQAVAAYQTSGFT